MPWASDPWPCWSQRWVTRPVPCRLAGCCRCQSPAMVGQRATDVKVCIGHDNLTNAPHDMECTTGALHASYSPPVWVRVRRPHNQLLPVVRGRRFMASPDEHTLTFLRGSGFLLSLVGVWDLMADASGLWPSQKGFLIFQETKMIAVIERNKEMRRGIEGTYTVEGNRIILTELSVDTAPERGALGEGEFA